MTRTVKNCSLIRTCKEKGFDLPIQTEVACGGCIRRDKLHPTCVKCSLCALGSKFKGKGQEEV